MTKKRKKATALKQLLQYIDFNKIRKTRFACLYANSTTPAWRGQIHSVAYYADHQYVMLGFRLAASKIRKDMQGQKQPLMYLFHEFRAKGMRGHFRTATVRSLIQLAIKFSGIILRYCMMGFIYRVSRGNVPESGGMFLTLKYTDITQNTYIRS